MKVKLPIIGLVTTGSDTEQAEPSVKVVKTKNKSFTDGVLGGFLQLGRKGLSDEKTVSAKVLEANKEWVYRNNDVIAKEVATLEFELYQIGMKTGETTFTEVEDHPLLDALDRFNDKTTKSDALYNTQSHKKLTGDSFWLLDFTGDTLNNIFILPPDKVELDIDNPTDASDELVKGYTYKDVINGKKIEKYYKPEEIIHFKTPNPKNMFRGYGAVEAMADTIDIDNLTNFATRRYFEQGPFTNFVLSTEAKVHEEQLKRLNAEFRAMYGGVSNAGKAMILGGGLKPEKMAFSNRDMEFLAQLEWYRDKIMVGFGNTKASLGIIDDVNRASHESSIIAWKRNTIKPDMQAIVDTLNEFLVPRFGDKLVLGFCDPVPEDRNSKVTEVSNLITSNVITPDEARELLGYDPINSDQSQNLRQPNTATEAIPPIPKSLQNINIKSVLRRNGTFQTKTTRKELYQAALPLAKSLIKARHQNTRHHKSQHAYYTDEQVWKYYEKQIHIVDVIEERFENSVTQYLTELEAKVLRNLDSELENNKSVVYKALYDESDEISRAMIDFTPLLMEQAVAAGQQAFNLIGKDDPYLATNMREFVKDSVRKFAKSMLDTDQDRLSNIISDGINDGKSVPQIKGDIQEAFSSIKKNQAKVITRTEVLRTSNVATLDAYKESGVVEGKQWLTAPGADPNCEVYGGKIVGLDDKFYGTKSEFEDGNPPIHPNCRCILLPVLEKSKAFAPISSPEKALLTQKITELEDQVDKRTKAYKELKEQKLSDAEYIAELERIAGIK
jgi:HK97 family phage portal protein